MPSAPIENVWRFTVCPGCAGPGSVTWSCVRFWPFASICSHPSISRRKGDIRSVQPLSLRDLDLSVHAVVAAFSEFLSCDDGLIIATATAPSTAPSTASRSRLLSRLGLRGWCRGRSRVLIVDVIDAVGGRSGKNYVQDLCCCSPAAPPEARP